MNKFIAIFLIIILLSLCVGAYAEEELNVETVLKEETDDQTVDKEKIIKECENEIEEHKECISKYTVKDTWNDDINNYLNSFCFSFFTDKCEKFYENLISNNSACSIAKQYKSFGVIDDFDEEYRQLKIDCEWKIDYTCRTKLASYKECNASNYESDKNLLINTCVHFESEECQDLYNNSDDIEKLMAICPSDIMEVESDIPDSNKLKLHYEKNNELCKDILSNSVEICENELKKHEEGCLYDISSIKNDDDLLIEKCAIHHTMECQELLYVIQYSLPICVYAQPYLDYDLKEKLYEISMSNLAECNSAINGPVREKIIKKCEDELSPYDECLFKFSLDLTDDELSQKCAIYNSEKCQSFYNNNDNFQTCKLISSYSWGGFDSNPHGEEELGYFAKKDPYNSDIVIYDRVCNFEKEVNIEQCKIEFSSFEPCLFEDEDYSSDEEEQQEELSPEELLKEQCIIFNGPMCNQFYLKKIDEFIPSCFAADRYEPIIDKLHSLSLPEWKYENFKEQCSSSNYSPFGGFDNVFGFGGQDNGFEFGSGFDGQENGSGFGFGSGFGGQENGSGFEFGGQDNGFGFGSGFGGQENGSGFEFGGQDNGFGFGSGFGGQENGSGFEFGDQGTSDNFDFGWNTNQEYGFNWNDDQH